MESSPRKSLGLLFGVLLAGLMTAAWFVWQGRQRIDGERGFEPAELTKAPAGGGATPMPGLELPAVPRVGGASEDSGVARVALATRPQLVMERPTIIRGGETIRGRYLLEHADVAEGVLATRASFVLDVAFDEGVRSLEVEVVRGHWSCELPVPFREVLRLEVRDVQVDGRPCERQASISPAVGAETIPNDIVVRGRCAWDALLEVVDALTQRPLDEALVVPIEFASAELPVFHAQLPAPPPRRTPLDLAPFATKMPEQHFFVSSPGYGWKRISVDLSRESTQRVELVPGGELALLGAPSSGDLRVSEVLADGSLRVVLTGSCSTLPWTLTGLAPGEYEVLTFPPPDLPPWPESGAPPLRFDRLKLNFSDGNLGGSVHLDQGRMEYEHGLLLDPPKPVPQLRLRARVTLGARSELLLER